MGNIIKRFANVPVNNIPSLSSPPSHHLVTEDWSGRISTGEPPNYHLLCGGTGADRLCGPPGTEARLTQASAVPQIFISSCLNNNSLKEKKPFKYFSGENHKCKLGWLNLLSLLGNK